MAVILTDIDKINESFISKDKNELEHFKMLQALQHPKTYIENVDAIVKVFLLDGKVVPVTINDKAYNTSYVCSPYTAIISYSKHEIKKINNNLIQLCLRIMIFFLDPIFKISHIDRIVSNNNFILSTNLLPSFQIKKDFFRTYLDELITNYPKHTILFRSLNRHTNNEFMNELQKIGFKFAPSRQVYFFHKNLKDYTKNRDFKKDMKCLQNNKDYTFCMNDQLEQADYSRIAYLYKKLYVDKYSKYNPIFNEKYIEYSHKNSFIEYFGLRNKNGILDAVIGSYDRGNITTNPIVGYDTDLPQNLGLYRLVVTYATNRANLKSLCLNASSGAPEFKTLRGGVAIMEYSAIYTRHLKNPFQKYTWSLLCFILVHIIEPILRKFKL